MLYANVIKIEDYKPKFVTVDVEETAEKKVYKLPNGSSMFITDAYVSDNKKAMEEACKIFPKLRSGIEILSCDDTRKYELNDEYYNIDDFFFEIVNTPPKKVFVIEDSESDMNKKKEKWNNIFLCCPDLSNKIIEFIDAIGLKNIRTVKNGNVTYVSSKVDDKTYEIVCSITDDTI